MGYPTSYRQSSPRNRGGGFQKPAPRRAPVFRLHRPANLNIPRYFPTPRAPVLPALVRLGYTIARRHPAILIGSLAFGYLWGQIDFGPGSDWVFSSNGCTNTRTQRKYYNPVYGNCVTLKPDGEDAPNPLWDQFTVAYKDPDLGWRRPYVTHEQWEYIGNDLANDPWTEGAPKTMPLPDWQIPWLPQIDPGEEPVINPGPNKAPFPWALAPRRRDNPYRDTGPKPRPRPRPLARTTPKRPPKGTKEKKLIIGINSRSAFGLLLGALSETTDFVNALHDALPDSQQVDGKTYDKARAVYQGINDLNWEQAIQNLILEQIEDAVFGFIGQQVALSNRKAGLSVGHQTTFGIKDAVEDDRQYQGGLAVLHDWL